MLRFHWFTSQLSGSVPANFSRTQVAKFGLQIFPIFRCWLLGQKPGFYFPN
jgi:hypothetical protein